MVEATAPIPGLDPARLLDVRVGTELVDQVSTAQVSTHGVPKPTPCSCLSSLPIPPQDARDVKVMELAKKVRTTNVALQKERTKVSQLMEERDK